MIALPLARAAGLVLGAAADAVLGDPRRGHPVAGFGVVAAALERRGYADRWGAGVRHVAVLVGGAVAVGAVAERAARGPVARAAVTALATWVVLGGTSLAREGAALAVELDRDDLAAARARLPGLCGRDPSTLDAGGLARAGTESMAENTSDAVVAPLLWGALAGVPGLLGYRAVNTLDAMVGHRSPRYARFGWAAARLDDVANLLPARVCALLTAAVAPASVARLPRPCAPGDGTPRRTRARTPARWRRRPRVRSASRWAGARCTPTAWRSARGSATARPRARPTCGGRPGCPGWSAWRRPVWPPSWPWAPAWPPCQGSHLHVTDAEVAGLTQARRG